MNYIITQKRKDAIGIVNNELVKRLDFKHIEIPWGKNMLWNHIKELFFTIKFSRKLKETDVIFSTNSKSVHTHFLPFLCKCKKYMLHFHFDEAKLGLHRFPFFSYAKLFKQWHTIFATKSMRDDAIKDYGEIESSVAYCGVDKDKFKNYGNSRLSDYFLYVGSFIPRKNVNNLLKGFKLYLEHHKDAKLVILNGYGKTAEFDKWITDLGLTDNIVYLRDVPLETLVMWYNVCTAFIFPTLIEGFGLPLVEAMLCGCPVITSNRDLHKEITFNSATYVDPLNPHDIFRGMEELKHVNLSKKAAIYDWDNMVKSLQSIM